jgi:hypothetical protein
MGFITTGPAASRGQASSFLFVSFSHSLPLIVWGTVPAPQIHKRWGPANKRHKIAATRLIPKDGCNCEASCAPEKIIPIVPLSTAHPLAVAISQALRLDLSSYFHDERWYSLNWQISVTLAQMHKTFAIQILDSIQLFWVFLFHLYIPRYSNCVYIT